jgi:hypothetical protein
MVLFLKKIVSSRLYLIEFSAVGGGGKVSGSCASIGSVNSQSKLDKQIVIVHLENEIALGQGCGHNFTSMSIEYHKRYKNFKAIACS